MTTGNTTALTRWMFVDKVMSLLFNMVSRLVTGFLPRRKHVLISWLQSPSAVILEPKKVKSVTVSVRRGMAPYLQEAYLVWVIPLGVQQAHTLLLRSEFWSTL